MFTISKPGHISRAGQGEGRGAGARGPLYQPWTLLSTLLGLARCKSTHIYTYLHISTHIYPAARRCTVWTTGWTRRWWCGWRGSASWRGAAPGSAAPPPSSSSRSSQSTSSASSGTTRTTQVPITVQCRTVQYSTVQYNSISSSRWRLLSPAAAPHSARARAGGGQPSAAGRTRHQARIHLRI